MKILGYGLFTVVVILALVWWKFPYEEFRSWLTQSLSAATGAQVALGELSPSLWPPGFRVASLSVQDRQPGQQGQPPLVLMDDVTLGIQPLSLLTGRLGAELSGTAYAGTLELDARSGALFDTDELELDLDAANLDLGQHPRLPALLKVSKLTGLLGAKLHLTSVTVAAAAAPATQPGQQGQPGQSGQQGRPQVSGEGSFSADNFTVNTTIPYLLGGVLDLGQIRGKLTIDGDKVTVTSLEFKSQMLDGQLSGTITLAEPLDRSQFDLAGTWRVDPSVVDMPKVPEMFQGLIRQRKPLPVSVKGTPGSLQLLPI